LELKARLEERPYRVVDTGIHPKILADWNRKNLLMVKPKPNRMHRFSLTEFVWVKFIEKMREYNFPLPVIKALRDELFTDSFASVMDEFTPSVLFDLMKDVEGIRENPQQFREFLDTTELKKVFEAVFPMELLNGNLLELLILLSLFLQSPMSFFIDKDGKYMIFNPLMLRDGLYEKEEISGLFTRSFISISLSEVLAEVLVLSEVEILVGQLMIITDEEANVIQALREDDLLSVSVRYDKDHVMDLLEVTKGQKVEREARLLELMLKDGYQDITLKTQHGKVVYCENTRKVKLK
jgi:DNA-binding transcriptional MerR regulator